MSTETIDRARAMRRRYPFVGARTRLAWARATTERPDWADEIEHGRPFEVDGYTVVVITEPDTDPDLSWLGEFLDRWTPGAIPNTETDTHRPLRWFLPAYTYDERRADLSRLGYSRGEADRLAREQLRQDYRAALDYAPYFIGVAASVDGIELGHASLGGVDYDDVAQAVLDHDLIGEAIDDARKAHAELCAHPTLTPFVPLSWPEYEALSAAIDYQEEDIEYRIANTTDYDEDPDYARRSYRLAWQALERIPRTPPAPRKETSR